jgi:uncharacterized protein
MSSDIFGKLIAYAQSVFSCGESSIHGLTHWNHVDDSAQLICQNSDSDLAVVRFFAFLHDSCRLDDGADLDHGPRAADSLVALPSELVVLDTDQMGLLEYAIRHHTDGRTSDDLTIGACWDSDRLDLGRVGMIPDAVYMSTEPGREIARLGSKAIYRQKSV